MGQLRGDGVPVDVNDRLVAGLLLDDLECAPREVLRSYPPDVAVPRDGEGAVGGAELHAMEGRPDQGRLELVAVELDGAVAVVPHVRPLDEVEDAGSMRNR